jgi:hypothetical protein
VNSSTNQAESRSSVVSLASYRSGRKSRYNDAWKRDQEFCAALAVCLRKRAGWAEIDPDGPKRLAVAFDLRRINLVNSLLSMLDEQYLIYHASFALDLARQLDDVLTTSPDQAASARATAYQLAYALDAVVEALEMRRSSAHATRR